MLEFSGKAILTLTLLSKAEKNVSYIFHMCRNKNPLFWSIMKNFIRAYETS